MKKFNQFFFYLAWTIYLVFYIVVNDSCYKNILNYHVIDSVVKATTVCLLFVSIVFICKYNIKSIFIIAVTFGIFVISSMKSGSQQISMCILFGLAAKDNINMKKFVKYDMILRTLLLLFVLISVYLNIIENVKVEINGYEKSSFGFCHVNIFGMIIGTIFAEFVMLFYKKVKGWHTVIFIAGILLLYKAGISRTSLISMALTFALMFAIKIVCVEKFVQKHYKLISLYPLIMSLICCVLAIIYNKGNPILRAINNLLSTRLHWAHFFYRQHGFSLFGSKIITISTESAKQLGVQAKIFDMGFLRIAVEYGILVFIFFMLIMIIGNRYAIQTKNYGLALVVFYFSLSLIVETGGYNVINNFTLIFFTRELLNSDFVSKKRYNRLILKEKINMWYENVIMKGK